MDGCRTQERCRLCKSKYQVDGGGTGPVGRLKNTLQKSLISDGS